MTRSQEESPGAASSSGVVDEDAPWCPLCCNQLDLADIQSKPCSCDYAMCAWCYNTLGTVEKLPKCPSCRRAFTGEIRTAAAARLDSRASSTSNGGTSRVSSSDVSSSCSSGGVANTAARGGSGNGAGYSGASLKRIESITTYGRNHLRDMRVVRRDLCYVVGLPLEVVQDESALKEFTYFGKYGRVLNVIVNRNPNFKSPDKKRSCAVYVTFSDRCEAIAAIQDLNERLFEGRRLRASYGTTKYCSSFLKNTRCQNRQCFYLHEKGADEDSFTVDELNQVKEASQTLTCSALLADEFPTAHTKRDVCFFGMDYAQLIDYYIKAEEGRKALNVLPSVAEKVAIIRSQQQQQHTPTTAPTATPCALLKHAAGGGGGGGDDEEVNLSLPPPPPPPPQMSPIRPGAEHLDDRTSEPSVVAPASSLVLLPPPPVRWATIVHPLLQQSWTLLMPQHHPDNVLEPLSTPPPPPLVEFTVAPISPEQSPHSPPSILMHCKGVTTADQVARRLHTHHGGGGSPIVNPPPGFTASR